MMDWRLLIDAAKGETNLLNLARFHHSDFDKVTPHKNNVLHIAAKHQRFNNDGTCLLKKKFRNRECHSST
ncbi:unnamed protein product [Brassica rapa]|uniref:PGG domain-containing protein n=2 Tax=Brassica TaxID=3705 RepID=A0A8D9GYE8_BRACM|nr:unnamed protein product [Brassica napus]CAG7889458.1 unnamed protein product [Brassica rapa]